MSEENPQELKMPRNHQELVDLMNSLIKKAQEVGITPSTNAANLSFYKESNALKIKTAIDQLIADPQHKPFLFLYDDYPKLAPNSLYAKINQSIRYLVEKLDTPDGHYRYQWEHHLDVTKKVTDTGLVLRWLPKSANEESDLMPRQLEDKTISNKWKNELDEWLENSKPGDQMKWPNLGLSNEEVAELKLELSTLNGLLFVVDNSKVIVAKKPSEEGKS